MGNSITDVFAALQNGVIALGKFQKQLTGSFNNISAQLGAIAPSSAFLGSSTVFVTTIAGNSGAFTLSTGITNASNDIQLVVPVTAPDGGTGVVSPAVHTIPINAGAAAQTNTGTGTSGQALISNGASADPSWKSGVRILLNTLTATNSSGLSDTTSLTNAFSEYEISFENVLAGTGGTNLLFQVHSGGAFQTTTYLATTLNVGAATGVTQPTVSIQLSAAAGAQTAGAGYTGFLRIFAPSGTTAPKQVVGQGTHFDSVRCQIFQFGGFWNGGNGAVDGFQAIYSAGNIASGTIKIYGFL